jgi:hypothetical protein
VTTTRKSKLQSEDKSEEDTKMTTTTKRSKVHTEDKSEEEDTKDSKFPVAQLDQEPSKNQAIYPDNIMILEKSTEVVTVSPGKLTKPIKTQDKDSSEHEDEHEDDHKPKKPLNQGSTLLLFLLAALLFCACLTASTLAFVSSFQNERTLEKFGFSKLILNKNLFIFCFFFILGKKPSLAEKKE